MEIIEVEQGTDEWFQVRAGVPTASMFGAVLAQGRGGAPSKIRKTYMHKLAGELITGVPSESFSTPAMERGHEMEIKARQLYEFQTDSKVDELGFVLNYGAGCSPDGVVGDKGLIEIKSKAPHLLIDVLLKNEMPSEHKAQVQGQLMVMGREWCDFVAFYTGMPMMIKRVYRDEEYIENLKSEIDKFNNELAELVYKVQALN